MSADVAAADPLAARAERRVIPAVPDWGWAEARFGLVLLSTDLATEPAFRAMAPEAVVWMTSRLANQETCTNANLAGLAGALPAALRLLPGNCDLPVIAFSCTSGVVAMGEQAVSGLMRSARPGVAWTAPILAAGAAFARLGVRRIGLLTPYIEEVDRAVAAWLAARGVAVPMLDSFDLLTDPEMTAVPPEAIARAALDLDRPDLDAIFISCTSLRTWPMIQAVEDRLGKPVVTSHQALLWHALRLAGWQKPIAGFGQLLTLDGGADG